MKKSRLHTIKATAMDKADDIEQRLDQAFQMKLVSRIAEAEGVSYGQALEYCHDGVNWPRYSIAFRLASPAWTMLRRMHPNDWHDAFKRNYPELTRWELECLETDYAYDNPEANVKVKWAIEERKARKERKKIDKPDHRPQPLTVLPRMRS